MYLDERLKMESNNNRQLIYILKQLNPMSAAENVLSMRKISHRANKIKNIRVNKKLKKYKPSKRGVSDFE